MRNTNRLAAAFAAICLAASQLLAADRLNLLVITVDDLSAIYLCFWLQIAGDKSQCGSAGQEAMGFTRAHVQVGNCMPSCAT